MFKCSIQKLKKSFISSNSNTIKEIYRPGHEGSVKNGSIDPLCEYLATSGCDG
jgi:hypothetical protein